MLGALFSFTLLVSAFRITSGKHSTRKNQSLHVVLGYSTGHVGTTTIGHTDKFKNDKNVLIQFECTY